MQCHKLLCATEAGSAHVKYATRAFAAPVCTITVYSLQTLCTGKCTYIEHHTCTYPCSYSVHIQSSKSVHRACTVPQLVQIQRTLHVHCALVSALTDYTVRAQFPCECIYSVHCQCTVLLWLHWQCTLCVHNASVITLTVYAVRAQCLSVWISCIQSMRTMQCTVQVQHILCTPGVHRECTAVGKIATFFSNCSRILQLFRTEVWQWHIAVLENFSAEQYAIPTTYRPFIDTCAFWSDWKGQCFIYLSTAI